MAQFLSLTHIPSSIPLHPSLRLIQKKKGERANFEFERDPALAIFRTTTGRNKLVFGVINCHTRRTDKADKRGVTEAENERLRKLIPEFREYIANRIGNTYKYAPIIVLGDFNTQQSDKHPVYTGGPHALSTSKNVQAEPDKEHLGNFYIYYHDIRGHLATSKSGDSNDNIYVQNVFEMGKRKGKGFAHGEGWGEEGKHFSVENIETKSRVNASDHKMVAGLVFFDF